MARPALGGRIWIVPAALISPQDVRADLEELRNGADLLAEVEGAAGGELQLVGPVNDGELLRGRYDRSQRWLRRAGSLAGDDQAERVWAHAVQGVALTDIGRHAEALRELHEALRLAGERDELRFVLIHSRDRILPELSDRLGSYALERLRRRESSSCSACESPARAAMESC